MELPEFVKQINNFKSFPLTDKILVIGYWLHDTQKLEWFKSSDVNAGFDKLHLDRPTNATSQMTGMTGGFVKRLMRSTKGFKLNSGSRDRVAAMLPAQVEPRQLVVELKKLEAAVTDAQQKTFLAETILCFQHGAYRASIVMAWNLAYHHVARFIFDSHLAAFNARLKIQYPKETEIKLFTDFEDMKEGIFIAVIKGGGLVTTATAKTMKAELDMRNTAAHPSSTIISPVTAEHVITDLVKNILLRPTL